MTVCRAVVARGGVWDAFEMLALSRRRMESPSIEREKAVAVQVWGEDQELTLDILSLRKYLVFNSK